MEVTDNAQRKIRQHACLCACKFVCKVHVYLYQGVIAAIYSLYKLRSIFCLNASSRNYISYIGASF